MKEQVKEVYKIEINNEGLLGIQKHSYSETQQFVCPFNSSKYCGNWCLHFGNVENKLGDYDYYFEDYDEYYCLRLTCGCGINIKSMEYESNYYD